MKKKLVSIIIVNWNGRKIIEDCLLSLKKISHKRIEIIIVDNNSTDGSAAFIKNKFKNIKLIQNKKNLGFAGGNNSALDSVHGEYVLLLNSDARVTRNFLQPLIRALESKKDIGIVQPLVLYTQNEMYSDKTINSAGTYFLNTGFLFYSYYGHHVRKIPHLIKHEIFSAYGACMLIKKELIDQIGLFDDDFFMYFEETDFCIRSLIAGYRILFEPQSVVYHIGAASSKNFGTSTMYFHSFKNRITSYIKNLSITTLITLLPLHLIMCEITSILYAMTGKFTYSLAIQKSIWWNINHIIQTLSKRNKIQSMRTRKDRKILRKLTKHPRFSYYLYLFRGLQYYKE